MKIFDSLVKFGKGFADLPTIGRYAVVVAALYFAFFFGRTKKETEFTQFRAEYQQLVKKADTLQKVSDSLETRVDDLRQSARKKDSTINKLTVTIEWRTRQNRMLVGELAEVESQMRDTLVSRDTATLLTLKDSAIANLKEQNANKDTIITQQEVIITEQSQIIDTLNLALTLSEQRADTLETFIQNLPKTPKDPDKFWGIPKPSRKSVAVVSFVSGVLATIFAIK
jgi:septal ring factor EnvC (AmiA/AmiB activator)